VSGYDVVRCSLYPNTAGFNPKIKKSAFRFEEKHGYNLAFTQGNRNRRIANPDGLSIDWSGKEDYHNQISVTEGLKWAKRYRACNVVLSWSAEGQGLHGQNGWGGKVPSGPDRDFIIRDEAIKHGPTFMRRAK
jgi:hypothetical protein